VGKSTLFNRLTKTRQALVDDLPGVTRDRLYGKAEAEDRRFSLVDTGGFDPPADQAFAAQVHAQIELALQEADVILFLVDGAHGLSPLDQEVANRLRQRHKPVITAVNKVDGPEKEAQAQEFHALGLAPLHFISAAHGYGVRGLLSEIAEALPPAKPESEQADSEIVRVAILGRPNVGKSSLLNALVGGERAVVSEVAGTTRDAVDTPWQAGGKDYLFIDTAGIRRQGKVKPGLDKAVVFRSLRAIERCQVAVVVADASEGLADQDLRVAGQAMEAHRALVLVMNKWDLLKGKTDDQKEVKRQVQRLLKVAPWAPQLYLSAKTGSGVSKLLPTINLVFADFCRRLATGPLNKSLEEIIARHQPPMVKGRRLKFYYASQVSTRPPTIVLFVNDPKAVHFSYQRYLNNQFREAMKLNNAPLRLIFRQRSGRKPRRRRS
jgi:GTP-binding protein